MQEQKNQINKLKTLKHTSQKKMKSSIFEYLLCVLFPPYGIIVLTFVKLMDSGAYHYQKKSKRIFGVAISTLIGIIVWGFAVILSNLN